MGFLVQIDGDWYVADGSGLSGSELYGDHIMAATTPDAIRDRAIAVVEALTPALGSPGFRAWRNEGKGDFQAWCEANPAACTRRVQIRTVGRSITPAVSNADVEQHECVMRVLVAYAQDARFGNGQSLDRDDAMDQDAFQIDEALGMLSRNNFSSAVDASYPDAMWLEGSVRERIVGESVDFIDLEFVYLYYRAR